MLHVYCIAAGNRIIRGMKMEIQDLRLSLINETSTGHEITC